MRDADFEARSEAHTRAMAGERAPVDPDPFFAFEGQAYPDTALMWWDPDPEGVWDKIGRRREITARELLALLEEVERLQHLVASASRVADEAQAELTELRQQKGAAYTERNLVLALAAYLVGVVDDRLFADFGAWRSQHEGEEWEDDWRNVVFIRTPAGQMSWHIHDSEAGLFSFLPDGLNTWDGHTTEEKYERLRRLVGAEEVERG